MKGQIVESGEAVMEYVSVRRLECLDTLQLKVWEHRPYPAFRSPSIDDLLEQSLLSQV